MKKLARTVRQQRSIILLALILSIILAGCRQETSTSEELNLEIGLEAQALAVGETMLQVSLQNEGGTSINDAKVEVRGDMSHAGMVPVIREVDSGVNGMYEVPFEWTMGGDWIVQVAVTLPDGEQAQEQFNYTVESSGTMDMSGNTDMDHSVMSDTEDMTHDTSAMSDTEEMNMQSGVVTAVYMTIQNQGDEADTLVKVETEVASEVQIHETSVDDNDVARMTQLEAVEIPADGEVTFEPGGLHLMLINVQAELADGDSLTVMLTFASGVEIMVDVIVAATAPEEIESQTVDTFVIHNAWGRPVAVAMP